MADGFYVRHNVTALFAHRQSIANNTTLGKALERLSSGYRINRASDDAAGLAVSEKLRTQVRGFAQALRNIQDATSLIQTAESGLQELHNILQRVRELSVQAANGIYTDSDRSLIQLEVDQLLNEMNRMQTSVEFNRLKLLDGTFSSNGPAGGATTVRSGSLYRGSMVFHVGANVNQTLAVFISTLSVAGLGLNSLFSSSAAVSSTFLTPNGSNTTNASGTNVRPRAVGIVTQGGANSAIGIIDSAINIVSRRRGTLGALENRLEKAFNYAGTVREQLQAAESRIRDADMAKEITEFTKAQVLVQSANAMLAQANLIPQNVLSLLG